MDCSQPGSSVHRISQARVRARVAISFSRGSSWPRDWTWGSCIAGRFFTVWATREAQSHERGIIKSVSVYWSCQRSHELKCVGLLPPSVGTDAALGLYLASILGSGAQWWLLTTEKYSPGHRMRAQNTRLCCAPGCSFQVFSPSTGSQLESTLSTMLLIIHVLSSLELNSEASWESGGPSFCNPGREGSKLLNWVSVYSSVKWAS